jgi:uncharacterized protein YcbK (DUF882 family)
MSIAQNSNIVRPDEWSLYPNFSDEEMRCSHTSQCFVTHKLMSTLQQIRDEFEKPMVVTSGYRDVSHPVERSKGRPGEHAIGAAADIQVYGRDALQLLSIALALGVNRIGINQKGDLTSRYIHIGVADQLHNLPEGIKFMAGIWTY